MIQMLNNKIIKRNNQIELMALPGWSIYGPIKGFLSSKPIGRGSAREKNHAEMIDSLDAPKIL